MFDVKIANGTVIDGTGGQPRRADVAVKDGRVAAIGTDLADAADTIDATGKVVAPGFIDVHTHYDAQVMWDADATPSPLHGVTTVIGGNCGFTIAPVDESTREYVLHMLACVEGMPAEALRCSLDWRWESFGEWLACLDGNVAVNAAFSVGHSTIRRLVMGDDWRRAATDEEIAQMGRQVDDGLDAGAIGFSSSWGQAHRDHLGSPVPSRFATPTELVSLAGRLRDRPGAMLEFIPSILPMFPDEAIDVMADMSVAAEAPLNWNVLSVNARAPRDAVAQRLTASDVAARKGGRVIALTMPATAEVRLNLRSTIALNSLEAWPAVMALPIDQRIAAFLDPDCRATLAAAMPPREHMNVPAAMVESVVDPSLAPLVGRRLADIAEERGCTPFDVLLDVSIGDRLRCSFRIPATGDDDESWHRRAELWTDPRTLIGASDAGAHLDLLVTAGFFTDFVGPTVRDRRLVSLPEAVRHLTDAPARFYGLADRGRVAEGWWADLVVFDPSSVANGPVSVRDDMPGGASRLYVDAIGVEHVLVNGSPIVEAGRLTPVRPGKVLRAGTDVR